MATLRRHELKPVRDLAPKAQSWQDLPKELREQLLQEAIKGKKRVSRA
jgi:hypothetical protein